MSVSEVRLDNVRRKSVFVERMPTIGRNTGTTIYPYVYLPRKIYDDIYSVKPNPYNIALVVHEQEHVKRIKQVGVLSWYAKYLISGKFRLEEELAATKPQFAYLKSRGLTFDLERKARWLSGAMYLWATTYPRALERLKAIWREV